MPLTVTTRGGTMREILAETKRAAKTELQAGMLYWYQEFLPKHFQVGVQERYGFKPRSLELEIRKSKSGSRGRRGQDLVFSGEMERSLRSRIQIGGSSQRVWGKMPGPKHLFGRLDPSSRMPDMKAEITKTLPGEEDAVARFVSARMAKRIAEIRSTHTTVYA